MSGLVWTAAGLLVAALGAVCGLTAAYDQAERRLDQEQGCACPRCDTGGSCEVES